MSAKYYAAVREALPYLAKVTNVFQSLEEAKAGIKPDEILVWTDDVMTAMTCFRWVSIRGADHYFTPLEAKDLRENGLPALTVDEIVEHVVAKIKDKYSPESEPTIRRSVRRVVIDRPVGNTFSTLAELDEEAIETLEEIAQWVAS